MVATYLGIDLTAGRRPSSYAVLNDGLRLLALGSFVSDAEGVACIEQHRPACVAIDSPLGLPLGVDCFDEGHPCRPLLPGKGKASERALSRLGIPCYYTSKRSIIKEMVLRAMGLREALEGLGYPVIEVYPYAVKVRLWGRSIPRKTTPQGRTFLRDQIAALIPDVAALDRPPTHDEADALLVAYTAWLYGRGEAEGLGDPEEGFIYLPAARGLGNPA